VTRPVAIYDTTLRDGAQREGISFSLEDKLKIARRLDEFGVNYIEGGWPGSNPKDREFFLRGKSLPWRHARLVAVGNTRKPRTTAPDDNIEALLRSETAVVTVVGKSWDLHVHRVLGADLDENLRMIEDSLSFLKRQGLEVIYDAEHFFDGYRADPEYALRTLKAAEAGGADCIVLCDTNGGSLPSTVKAVMEHLCQVIRVPLGIHAHNDSELAVANTLAAVEAGATHVQGTINGFGERCGNANLCSIIPNLELKMGIPTVGMDKLRHLSELSRYVSEVANISHDTHLPFVGESAFAHKGGLHTHAIMRATESYEHINPEQVGNSRRILISELGGRSSVLHKALEFGIDLRQQTAEARRVAQMVKDMESRGFQFEAAEASFELLVRRNQPGYVAPFELIDFLVLVEKRGGVDFVSEATVKLRVAGEVMHTAAEGNGPVNALDAAMRKALLQFYPSLAEVGLVDYKVRVLDGKAGTEAVVRVTIESRAGDRTWSTMGSSTNIIEASWLALADSLEYFLITWPCQPVCQNGNGPATTDVNR